MKNIDKFYSKLPKKILDSKEFYIIKKYIDNDPDSIDEYLFCCSTIESMKNIDVNSNKLLKIIYNYETPDRGGKKGKAELLVNFLMENAFFSTGRGDIVIDSDCYEVKAYSKENDAIAFGVMNTFTLIKLGKQLLNLFWAIEQHSNNEAFRKEFPFWFDTKNRGNWKNVPKINKLIGMEITPNEFKQFTNEIPRLRGIIDHEYVNDISIMQKDITDFNNDFNKRDEKILLFVGGNFHSNGVKYEFGYVTQSRAKMIMAH